MQVCKVDGVEVVEARSGKLIHLDEIPRGIDPEHAIERVDLEDYELALANQITVKEALLVLLRHHDTLCPGCEFRKVARRALRMPEE